MLAVVHHSEDRAFAERLRTVLRFLGNFECEAIAIDEVDIPSAFAKAQHASVVIAVLSQHTLAAPALAKWIRLLRARRKPAIAVFLGALEEPALDAIRRRLTHLDPIHAQSDDPPPARYREIVDRVSRLLPKPNGDLSDGPTDVAGGDDGGEELVLEELEGNGARGIGNREGQDAFAGLLDDTSGDAELDLLVSAHGTETMSWKPGDAVLFSFPKKSDPVHFAVFAPHAITPSSSFLLDVWAHTQEQRTDVLERATKDGERAEVGEQGPIAIERGLRLDVVVDIPGFRYRSKPEPLLWIGEAANASFPVQVPKSAGRGSVLGSARISHRGLRLAMVHFELAVGVAKKTRSAMDTREERVSSVFASYANEDRDEALRVRRALEPLGVDVFIDVVSLRLGQDWQKELKKQIPARDRFYLLWSKHAAESEWVEKEWRFALREKGLDFIDPVALADPRDVPPPKALAKLHFTSDTLPALAYEAQRRTRKEKPAGRSRKSGTAGAQPRTSKARRRRRET